MIRSKHKTGFTLIELLVVILIVGILASVAIPIFRWQIDRAKWSEGKAMMGTIAGEIRAWRSEKGGTYAGSVPEDLTEFGYNKEDLNGNYFAYDDFSFKIDSIEPLTFTITATPHTQPDAPQIPSAMTMTTKDNGLVVWSDE